MTRSKACSVSWCVFVPEADESVCAVHRQFPVWTSERADEWRTRVAAEKRAAVREANRQAAQREKEEAKRASA